MDKIISIRKTAEFDTAEELMPTPTSIVTLAHEVEEAPVYRCASDYGETIDILRNKNYTWQEIADFLNTHGISFSRQAFVSGWRTWKRRQKCQELV